MNLFSSIDKDLEEVKKIDARKLLVTDFRKSSTAPVNPNSTFFKPLLFDPNIVGKKNCENLAGQISIPVGIVGPITSKLTVGHETSLLKDLLVPLATTEGALVASVNRGCKILNKSKNLNVRIKNVGMTRAPVFKCSNDEQARVLTSWIKQNLSALGKIGESTSQHLTYLNCKLFQKNNLVFARFAFDTGSAMGMNMVSIATAKITQYIVSQNPRASCLALSSNVCSDKKSSALNRRLGRGRWVTVTCNIPNTLISSILKTNSTSLMNTYHAKIVIGSKLAGLSGSNMQVANIAAAILAATGQDLGHTVDISQGTLTLKLNSDNIFAKLSLPTVPVGTIGGGTWLEAQSTARNLISSEPVTSDILAAVIGLASLAGELSGLAALSTNSLSSSHERLGRS